MRTIVINLPVYFIEGKDEIIKFIGEGFDWNKQEELFNKAKENIYKRKRKYYYIYEYKEVKRIIGYKTVKSHRWKRVINHLELRPVRYKIPVFKKELVRYKVKKYKYEKVGKYEYFEVSYLLNLLMIKQGIENYIEVRSFLNSSYDRFLKEELKNDLIERLQRLPDNYDLYLISMQKIFRYEK